MLNKWGRGSCVGVLRRSKQLLIQGILIKIWQLLLLIVVVTQIAVGIRQYPQMPPGSTAQTVSK